MSISILGAGAFGTAMAVTLSKGREDVMLWGRDAAALQEMEKTRENLRYLQGIDIPKTVTLIHDVKAALASDIICLSVPMQQLSNVLLACGTDLNGKTLVACCKGIDLMTSEGPTALIKKHAPTAKAAVLTGPSFAHDIAKGLPTALTLACSDPTVRQSCQDRLSTSSLRIYTSGDVIGAELGGALKNVIAIACGATIGAGYGDSARAALMTRGYAEMCRIANTLGAKESTLSGLSGFGDLSLTCMSAGSRNFSYGLALGCGCSFDPSVTVEGVATAKAVLHHPKLQGADMPITRLVHHLSTGDVNVKEAMQELMSRPQKEE